MSWIDDIFGAKKTSESTQTGTSNSQSNAWNDPRLQQLFNSLFSQVGQAQTGNVPLNQYQTGAANQLSGAGNMVMPAYNAAGDVANSGITTDNIEKYMSPHIQNVVNATQNQFDQMNARTLAGQQASRAKAGALTGTQGNVGRAFGEMQLAMAQNPVIAGLYQQGYNNAVDTAGKDAAVRTQAAGTQGNLVNTYTNAGQAAYGAGQSMWEDMFKNTWSPLQYSTQAASSLLSPFLTAAGMNNTSSGTATGEQTSRDSLWNIGKGVMATGMAMYSDERVKHDIKPVGKTFDGMPIYTFKYNGDESGRTHMGLMAQDVEQEKPHAVGSFQGVKTVDYDKATRASGGGVGGSKHKEFHEKVTDAFKAITEMKRSMGGGVMPRHGYATDGFVNPAENDPGVNYDPTWGDTTVQKEEPAWKKWAQDNQNIGYGAKDDGDMLAKQQASLSQFMSGLGRADGGDVRRGYADGRSVLSLPGNMDMPEGGFWGSIFSNTPKGGVLDGEPMSKWDRLTYLVGNSSISTDGSGKAGVTDALMNLSNDRLNNLRAEREAATLLGEYRGAPTMAAKQLAFDKGKEVGVVDGYDTIMGRKQSESERTARLPEYGDIGGVDDYGQPRKGWINKGNAGQDNMAPSAPYRTPPTSGPSMSAPPRPGQLPTTGMEMSLQQPQTRAAGSPGSTPDNPVYAPNVAAETELIKTAPGTYYRTSDGRVKRTPDDPTNPNASTSPPPQQRMAQAPQPRMPGAPQQPPMMPPQPSYGGFVNPNDNDPALAGPSAPPRSAQALPQPTNEGPNAGQAAEQPALRPGQQQPGYGFTPPATPGISPVQTSVGPEIPNDVSGPEILNYVPKPIAIRTQRALAGLEPPPTGKAALDPSNRVVLQLAQRIEPGFDSNRWANRAQMHKAYLPDGKVGSQIKMAENTINHIYELDQIAKKLGNWDVPFGETARWAVGNRLARNFQSGKDSFGAVENAFKVKADLAVHELVKFLSGGTGGTGADREKLMARFDSAKNYSDLKAATDAMIEMMHGKMRPFVSTWNQEMRDTKPADGFFDQETRSKLHQLEGKPGAGVDLGKDIGGMSMEELKGLPRDRMSPEQLRAAAQRFNQLSQGPRP